MTSAYRPPAPIPMSPLRSLVRVIRQGDGDLLSLVPREAYEKPVTYLGYSRRSILLINDPEIARHILTDPVNIFPKNDLMVGALAPLVGDSIFVSSGERWRRQRDMIDPAFSHMRISSAFNAMSAGVTHCETILDSHASLGSSFSLDLTMSQLTADVICRTIFSTPLQSDTAKEVFIAFAEFEKSVASVNLRQLIFGKPWADIKQPTSVLNACEKIRRQIGKLLDPKLEHDKTINEDIASTIIAARDGESGKGFSREELIDQMGVFFLAGHETTASVLTWIFYIVTERPEILAKMRTEIDQVIGNRDVTFADVKSLKYIRNVFRETLRLYPPITFIPRVAAERTKIGSFTVKKGAMLMISPWTAHRNTQLWNEPDRFKPERFETSQSGSSEAEDNAPFMSFGLGPRVCVGAAFATIESSLILAKLVRRYDFTILSPEKVRPVARLTTRPAEEIRCKVRLRLQ